MIRLLLSFLFLFFILKSGAQKGLPVVSVLTQGTNTSIRGLSVVNNKVIWASGSRGTVGRSTDGGKTWKWTVVKGFETRDFRDIEAFDAHTAVVMAVDTPAFILRTIDGGDTWRVVYENRTPGMFLDAMEFWSNGAGLVIGDPIKGRFFVGRTSDWGKTWQDVPESARPVADSGEALFAASGTVLRQLSRNEAVIVSGGLSSHIIIQQNKTRLPITQGASSKGAFSVAAWNPQAPRGATSLVVVGGDYTVDTSTFNNCYYSHDRGLTWNTPRQPPHGYRSSVEYLNSHNLVACGTSGVDYSTDGAKTWSLVSTEGFHVVRKAKNGKAVFLAGSKGRIARLLFP